MRARVVVATVLLPLFLAASGNAQTHLWSRSFTDAGDVRLSSLAASNTIFIAGLLDSTADFGGGALTSAGGQDVAVAMFASDGSHLWSAAFGDTNDSRAFGAAMDDAGNVAITGWFEGTIDFGGGPLTSAGLTDVFLALFSPNGAHLWSQRFGDGNDETGRAVHFDHAGNVIVCGDFHGQIDFGGGLLTAVAAEDMFLAKFDAAGNHLWSQSFGEADFNQFEQIPYDVAVTPTDDIVTTGLFRTSLDFGPDTLTSASFEYDIFLAKFDGAGVYQWGQSFDALGGFGTSVDVNASGDIALGAFFATQADFGGGVLTTAGDVDAAVAKFDGAGSHLWSRQFGDGSLQELDCVAFDGGDVLVAGTAYGTIDLGGGPLTSAGGADLFVAKLAGLAGSHVWSRIYGDGGQQLGGTVASDGAGSAMVVGVYNGSIDFGGGSLPAIGTSLDTYLARLGSGPTTGASPVVGPGDRIEVYPNPASPSVTIAFDLPRPGPVTLAVYSVDGARVATVVDGEFREAGRQRFVFAPRLGSGVYVARLEHSAGVVSRKFTVLR